MQNLNQVLTIKGKKISHSKFCYFLILEAWSLHALLCPIYTSPACRALFCHLVDWKKTTFKMMVYFHTQSMQMQLLNQVLLHIHSHL